MDSIDIQFRLLRADSISGLQQGLHALQEDVQADNFFKTERTLDEVARAEFLWLTVVSRRLREGGGWYIDHCADRDSVYVYHLLRDEG